MCCVCLAQVELHDADSPRLHSSLQSLQTSLHQVQRLEKQCGAGPTERATHEGFDSWRSLGRGVGEKQ